MTTTYRRTNAESFAGDGADFSKLIRDPADDTTGSLFFAVANEATETSFGWTDVGVPGADGANGDFTAEVFVSVGSTAILCSMRVARMNATGSQQAISAQTAEQQMTGGLHTFTLTNVNLGTWSAGDRLRVLYIFRSTNAHGGAASIEVTHGGTDNEVVAPWTITAVPQVSTTIPLVLDVGADTQVDHDATAAVPLALDVGADIQAVHDASVDVPLSIAVDPVASAPGVGPAEVTATIPLVLDVGANTQATHDATADVPLGLDVGATTAAPSGTGEVTAAIPLVLTVGADAATEYRASAAIPLVLSVDPAAATSHVAVASVPLGLDIAAIVQVEHLVTAQVPLLLVLDPRTIDPELVSVPVSFVVGQYPGPAGAPGRHEDTGAPGSREDVAAPGLHEITINIEGASP